MSGAGSTVPNTGPHLSVNQPFFPLNQLAVWDGPGGIRRKEKIPITRVKRPYKLWVDGSKKKIKIKIKTQEAYLNKEHPSPTGLAVDASHVQQAVSHQSWQNVGSGQGGPEKAQANREFVVLIEVR
jgi:hypothetical protein